MSVSFTWDLQAQFAGTAGAWTSIKADVVSSRGIQWNYGIQGNGPMDRIAATGQLVFSLDNSTLNSAGSAGYYSPDHASVRSGFGVGIGVRLTGTYAGTAYYKFAGRLESIAPSAFALGDRVSVCTVVDWMDEAAKQKTANIATQTNKRADEIISAVVANMTRQPVATSYAAAQLEYPYALDTAEDEATSAMTELAKAVYSDLGYLYIKGDTATGGVLRFDDRRVRQAAVTSLATLSNTMSGLTVSRSRSRIYNRVKVSTSPRRVDTAATTVLYQYDSPQLLALGPGESVTIIGQYRDPAQRAQRVGGVDLVAPVATTDYTFGTGPGDTSLTASLTVSASSGGNSAIITLTNGAAVSGFVTKLQVRGRGLYAYDPVTIQAEDDTSKTAYGEFVLTMDLPHEARQHVATSVTAKFLAAYKNPRTDVDSVEFWANYSDPLMTAALAREPGDLITLTETLTGLNTSYFINGVSYEIVDGANLRASWVLAPDIDTVSVFVLNTSTLDSAAVLGW